MSRPTGYGERVEIDKVAYNRELYAKSDRERLRRINYTRVARGMEPIQSLASTKLRSPVGRL